MVEIVSERAKAFLKDPRHVVSEKTPAMRKYPGHPDLWAQLEWGEIAVKNLSFTGTLADHEKVLLESMARLVTGKRIDILTTLTARECEAFLRDRNSVLALEGLTDKDDKDFKSFLSWLSHWPRPVQARPYFFSAEKGPFERLPLVEKVRELKAFLRSPEILSLYENLTPPELIDVDGLTVYVEAPYRTSEQKALFEELHLLGVEAFQEENLNFIPEA